MQIIDEDGSEKTARVNVGKVRKMLLSAMKIVKKGHTIVLSDSQPSGVYHDRTGKFNKLCEKAGVYVMKLKVKKFVGGDQADVIAAVQKEQTKRSGPNARLGKL